MESTCLSLFRGKTSNQVQADCSLTNDDRLKKGEMKVTVIATGFPTDAPKKSLFSGDTASIPPAPSPTLASIFSSKEKTEEPAEKKEIHNSMPNDYLKKTEKKIFSADMIEENDSDEDDWNAIPAFLRRPKK